MASCRSASVLSAPPFPLVVGNIQVQEHQYPGLGIQAGQGQHPHNTPTLRL